MPSRPVLFQQRTNTSCYLAIPTRGFTAALSVFRGTPPAKPLGYKFKIRLVRLSNTDFWSWAHSIGEASLLVLDIFNLSPEDITWMSRQLHSQSVCLSLILFHNVTCWKTKNPAYIRKQGLTKSVSILYLLTASLSRLPLVCCPIGAEDSPRLNT